MTTKHKRLRENKQQN